MYHNSPSFNRPARANRKSSSFTLARSSANAGHLFEKAGPPHNSFLRKRSCFLFLFSEITLRLRNPLFTCISIRSGSDYIWLFLLIIALFLRVGSRIFFLIRRLVGVISSSSSVSMKSRHCSRLIIFFGTSFNASSALEERVLVNFFVLQTLISISSARALSDDHTGVNLYARSDEQGTLPAR